MPDKQKLYLIILLGLNTIIIKLVNKETWNWVNNRDALKPQDLRAEMTEDEWRMEWDRIGTDPERKNDRAFVVDGESFERFKDMIDFLHKNDAEIVEELHGNIY